MTTKHKQDCSGCEAESYTRNHYFTGKLMVERDFTDEQRYFREKIRIHHQRLHGSGVVCGLKIEAHDEPCDDRYVILQPGSAVDCCGRDILVTQPETIDLYAFPQMQALIEAEPATDTGDQPTHRLQLCIRYAECPTEDIPVLYDECGCDDTQCAPNRILESYAIDLLIDPELPAAALFQPTLDWETTLNLAHAAQVYLHETTQRLYVTTADEAGIVYQVSTDNHAVEASFALNRRVLALSAPAAGDELYVVVSADGGITVGDAELWVFGVSGTQLASGPVRRAVIAGSDNSMASALTLADDRLLLLFHSGGRLRLFDAGLAAPMIPVNSLDLGADLLGLSAASGGALVYSAEPITGNAHSFDADAADFAPAVIDCQVNALDRASMVYAVISTAPDQLLVLDADNGQLRLVDPAGGGSVTGTVGLAFAPRAAAISQGAAWVYVLVADGDKNYLQTVNLHRLRQGEAVLASTPVAVGDASQGLALIQSGQRLYAPYIDDIMVDNAGGVAVLDIDEANCADLLWQDLCPDCDSPDCLVLATIENYRPGFRVLDLPKPPPDALADLADSISRIDNRLGRRLLPSTQAVVEALICLMENCCNGAGGGEQGPPGLPGTPGTNGADGADGADGVDGVDGQDGRSITEVDVEMLPCGEAPTAILTEVGDDLHLRLELPANCNPNLAHLCNINWFHDHLYTREQLNQLLHQENDSNFLRFLIRFDAPVQAHDLNRHTIRVSAQEFLSDIYQTLGLRAIVFPGRFESTDCALEGFKRFDPPADGVFPLGQFADGAEILLPINWISALKSGFILRLSVHGDFIRDEKDRGADLDHLPLWLTNADLTQPTAAHTGNGVPGGEFISWFSFGLDNTGVMATTLNHLNSAFVDRSAVETIDAEPAASANAALAVLSRPLLSINRASRDELIALKGIGPELADAIIAARNSEPIRDEAGLRKISGIGNSLIKRLRDQITFEDGD